MKFRIGEADPAWDYETWSARGNGIVGKHYGVMTDDDIAALPVNEILEDDALFFLWTTPPKLDVALRIAVESWKLKYITFGFLQIKRYIGKESFNSWFMGNGHYTRANVEPCLLFKKGEGLGLPKDKGVKQVVGDLPSEITMEMLFPELAITRFEKHSKKPIEVYSGIERMYPKASKIRLFARDQREGWVSLGNEVTGNDIREDMERIISEDSKIKEG